MRRTIVVSLTILVMALVGLGATAQGVSLQSEAGTTMLASPAVRVVALEWSYAEDLLALGLQPVGVADTNGFRKWVTTEPALADDVADVGTRQEPSLESILALKPDLILAVDFRHRPILDQLNAIAPTLLFNPYPAEGRGGQLDEMRQTLRTIAAAVGRADVAEQVLADLDAHLAAWKARLAAAGWEGKQVLLAQAFSSQGSPQIRVFTGNALAMQVLVAIGLRDRWPNPYALYGFDTIDLEGVVPVSDADAFLYVAQKDDDVIANNLANNPIWKTFAFVRADHVYALGGDAWLFGGPLSAGLVADRIGHALTP